MQTQGTALGGGAPGLNASSTAHLAKTNSETNVYVASAIPWSGCSEASANPREIDETKTALEKAADKRLIEEKKAAITQRTKLQAGTRRAAD